MMTRTSKAVLSGVIFIITSLCSSCQKNESLKNSDTETVSVVQETSVSSEQATDDTESTISIEPLSEHSITDNSDETDGGNPDDVIEYHITIQNDRYLYNNHEISFDELKELLSENITNEVVIISDENANDQVYPQLIDYLVQNNIKYTEEDT